MSGGVLVGGRLNMGGVVGGLTCTLWQQQTDSFSSIAVGNIVSQKIKNVNGSTTTVCKIVLECNYAGGGTFKIQLRSAENGGGSQYDGDSDTLASSVGLMTFTLDVDIPTTTDFFINIVRVTGGVNDNNFVTAGYDAYEGAGYTAYSDASQVSSDDLKFEVWSLQ